MSVRQPRGLTDITCRLDTARAHRLCLEAPAVSNGSRYILAASDCTYEMPTHRLSSMIGRLYPHLPRVGGEEMSETAALWWVRRTSCARTACVLRRSWGCRLTGAP
jgi:hypothetical protein